eukprot:8656291-Pyramimonas_sp.AAC.1
MPTMAPRGLPRAPETAQERPKSPPKRAARCKNGPVPVGKRKFFRDSPLALQGNEDGPRGRQDRPKTAQE